MLALTRDSAITCSASDRIIAILLFQAVPAGQTRKYRISIQQMGINNTTSNAGEGMVIFLSTSNASPIGGAYRTTLPEYSGRVMEYGYVRRIFKSNCRNIYLLCFCSSIWQ